MTIMLQDKFKRRVIQVVGLHVFLFSKIGYFHHVHVHVPAGGGGGGGVGPVVLSLSLLEADQNSTRTAPVQDC